MITDIRERLFKSSWYKAGLWLLILVLFIVFTLPSISRITSGCSWVVKVNGHDIEYADFMRKVSELQQEIEFRKQQGGKHADALLRALGLNADPRLLALDILVREALMNQAAERLGITLTDDAIAQRLRDLSFVQSELASLIPPYVIDPVQGIIPERLTSYLKHSKISPEHFDVLIKQALLRRILLEGILPSIYMPVFELKQMFSADRIGKTFTLVKLDHAQRLEEAKLKKVTEQELTRFFDEQSKQGRYHVPEKRDIVSWSFDPSTYGVVVSESDIDGYYRKHLTDEFTQVPAQLEIRRIVFKIPTDAQAPEVYKQVQAVRQELVKNPTQFAQRARELSQDKATASQGGLMKPFAKGTHELSFDKAAFLLQNDGDISEIVKTSEGFELLQRVAKHPAVVKSLKTVENTIAQQLKQDRFYEQFMHDVKELQRGSDTQAALDDFVKKHNGIKREFKGQEFDESKIAKTAFAMEKPGVTSYSEGTKGILVHVEAITPSYVPAQNTLSTLEQDFYDNQAQELLQQELKALQEKAATEPLAVVAQKLGLPVQKIFIKKSEVGNLATLRVQGFPVDEMLQIEKLKGVFILYKGGHGYVVCLDEIEPINQELFDAKKNVLREQLAQERLKTSVQGFVASLYRNVTIKPNESVFSESLQPQQAA